MSERKAALKAVDIIGADLVNEINKIIRNSLHYNGIYHGYKGQSTKVMIDNIEFNFINGKVIQTAGWEHICLAFAKGLEIIDEIFSSTKFGCNRYTIKHSFLGD